MSRNERVLKAIFEAVDEFNRVTPEPQRLDKSTEAVLFGEAGKLDSLGLVNFIVAVEQKLEDDFGVSLTLANERAILSEKESPFKTLETLSEYASTLLEDQAS